MADGGNRVLARLAIRLHGRSAAGANAVIPNIVDREDRHTCATLVLTKGVHPKIVSEMLGHSSSAMEDMLGDADARGGRSDCYLNLRRGT